MSSKFIEKVKQKPTWSQKEILDMYEAHVYKKIIKPNEVKVGDVFSYRTSNFIPHPCVVLSISGENCSCVVISSTPSIDLYLMNCESRLFTVNSFITNNLVIVPTSVVIDSWIAEYGNSKQIVEIKRALKAHFNELLRITKKRI